MCWTGVWDEKITTFPGLYFVATAWVKLLDLLPVWKDQPVFQGMGADPRFLFKLRLLNSVFNVATFCLLYRIYRFKKASCLKRYLFLQCVRSSAIGA